MPIPALIPALLHKITVLSIPGKVAGRKSVSVKGRPTTQFFLLLLLLSPPGTHADDLNNIISCLGVSPAQFDYLWTTACDKKWQQQVPAEILENPGLIPFSGINSKMLAVSDRNADTVMLKAGPKRAALQKYYFDNIRDNTLIAEFIHKDRVFIEQYGYSVIDARSL